MRTVRLVNEKKARQRIIARTHEIQVGETYFLSSFYDKDGAMVKVLNKSTKQNRAGWPSSVTVEVLEKIGGEHSNFYNVGTIHTCNATNLYAKREDASHLRRKA